MRSSSASRGHILTPHLQHKRKVFESDELMWREGDRRFKFLAGNFRGCRWLLREQVPCTDASTSKYESDQVETLSSTKILHMLVIPPFSSFGEKKDKYPPLKINEPKTLSPCLSFADASWGK